MDIDWDYASNNVHMSMLSYIQDTLKYFHYIHPRRKQDQPRQHVKPTYGAKAQCTINKDRSPVVPSADNNLIQEVTGTFLYYVRAVNTTMLPALRTITTHQSNSTETSVKLFQTLAGLYLA